MTPEQLDEIEKDAARRDEATATILMLVKAVREARDDAEAFRTCLMDALRAELVTRKERDDAKTALVSAHRRFDVMEEEYLKSCKERDEARAEVERLREAAREVHALAEKTMLDAWCVGIGRETLRDIHKITKGMVK